MGPTSNLSAQTLVSNLYGGMASVAFLLVYASTIFVLKYANVELTGQVRQKPVCNATE